MLGVKSFIDCFWRLWNNMDKNCPVCSKIFTTQGFWGGENRIYCFDCLPYGLPKNERTTLNRILSAKRLDNYKLSIGCQLCGYSKCSRALEFHHVYPSTKDCDPGEASKRSWSKFLLERDKCVLLCANCHREQQDGLISDKTIEKIYKRTQG